MRNLTFKVCSQLLEAAGDFSNLVPGTEGYLFATFEFSEEWSDCIKVASFFDRKGTEYAVRIMNGKCQIPKEVLVDRIFKLQVFGRKCNFQISTNNLIIKQKG